VWNPLWYSDYLPVAHVFSTSLQGSSLCTTTHVSLDCKIFSGEDAWAVNEGVETKKEYVRVGEKG